MSRWFEDESLSTGRAPLMILFNRVRGGDVEMRFAGRPDSGGRCPTSLAA
jgi:hypothetical protein